MKYITIQGDTWDLIAHKVMGNALYADRLMAANPRHLTTYIFPAGVVLDIPEIDTAAAASPSGSLPSWKRVKSV
jgi:phage tail protein X